MNRNHMTPEQANREIDRRNKATRRANAMYGRRRCGKSTLARFLARKGQA